MDSSSEETWRRALLRFRQEKEAFFNHSAESPIPPNDRKVFGLHYFEPDPAYRVEVKLVRYPNPGSVVMATSKGSNQLFNRVGHFDFTVGGGVVTLQAYQSAERVDPSLFIPFRDATSGKESYGAARYIDMHVEHDDNYALDFNYAYNPYCAYSNDFVCPLPPRENWLTVPILAGEKKYHD